MSTAPASILVASASECQDLGPRTTSLLMDYLSKFVLHPPFFLGSKHIEHNAQRPHAQYLTFFWPHAQYARARVGLPHTSFHILLQPLCFASHTTSKLLQQLSPDVDIDALLRLARAAATFSPQYASVVDDLYDITALTEKAFTSIHVLRQITIIRMVAVSRLSLRDPRVLSEASSLVSLEPANPTSYLQRAHARCAAKQFWLAVLDIWYATLILDVQPQAQSRVVSLIARCLPHVPHIGIDVIFVPKRSALHDCFPAPYNSLIWERLSSEKQRLHNDIVNRVWSSGISKTSPLSAGTEFGCEYASRYAAYIWSLKHPTDSAAVKLPQMFLWLVPLRMAGSAMPSSKAQIAALGRRGFTLVVTLTIERQLQPSCFNESYRNLFLPIPKGGTPSFHQIDMFVAHVADTEMTLIHCMEGKSRTGLLMAVWLMLFGFSTFPSLCSKCAFLNCSDETNRFVGGCTDAMCALAVRQPEMSAQDALNIVKRQRAGLSLSHAQEIFLNDYNIELWRRYTVLQDLDENANPYEIVYPGLTSVSENDAELQVIGCPLQKFPSLIVLCGLPGSGKSFLAKRIVNLNVRRFAVACQDILGSRDSCLSLVSNTARRCKICPIVDRCNPRLSDREEWLRCAFYPSSAIVVHCDIPPEVCTTRAKRRINHPTLVPSSAGHVINGISRIFEEPDEKDVQAGFNAIYVIRGSVSLVSFLKHIGQFFEANRNGFLTSPHSEQDEKDSATCSRKYTSISEKRILALTDTETQGRSAYNKQNISSLTESSVPGVIAFQRSERPVRLCGLVKFPRTRHILDLGGSTKSDDLVMDNNELSKMIATLKMAQLEKSMTLTIEEKVDGANLGFSICPESGRILVQNRSHYVNAKSHFQFKLVNFFVNCYEEDLRKLLRDGERILYGEWMYAKHSILYSKLPSVFLAFDLFDKTEKKFLSRFAFRKELEDTRICSVREVRMPSEVTVSSITELALKCESHYYDGPAEGLYIRIDRDQWLLDRAKIVRPDFIVGNEHWTKRAHERNKFDAL